MMITWQASELPAAADDLGHGVCVVARAMEFGGEERVVAFVKGFNWLHSGIDAVVRFDRGRFPAGEALRLAIEDMVRSGRRQQDGRIAPGFFVQVNG